jgi:hypothetical protein
MLLLWCEWSVTMRRAMSSALAGKQARIGFSTVVLNQPEAARTTLRTRRDH